MLQKQDAAIKEVLVKYSSSQGKGAWLNELCEAFYRERPRVLEGETWPSNKYAEDDRKLCNLLSRGYINGNHLKKVVQRELGYSLHGPPEEWGYPPEKQFDGAFDWRPTTKSMVMVLEVSHSMNEVVVEPANLFAR